MAETPYIGESVPGEVMPTQEYVYDFSPIQQAAQDLTNLFASAQLKKAEKAQKAKEYWQSSMQEMPDVWEQDYEYVRGAVDEYNQLMKNFMYQGKDVSNLTPDEYKQYKAAEDKVVRYTKAAEDNQSFWNEAYKKKDNDKEGKYDPETFESFKQSYLSPDLDPLKRAEFRNGNDAFIADYDWDEILEYTVPKKTTSENGRIITSEFKPEDHRAYIESLFLAGDPEILDMFWARKRDKDAQTIAEKGEDYEESTDGYTAKQFTEEAVGLGKTKYNYTQSEEEIKSSGGSRGGGGGRGGNEPKIIDRSPASDEGSNSTYYDSTYKPKAVQGASESIDAVNVIGYGPSDFSVKYFTKGPDGKVYAYGDYTAMVRGSGKKRQGWVDYNEFKGEFEAAGYPDMNKAFGSDGGKKGGGNKLNG